MQKAHRGRVRPRAWQDRGGLRMLACVDHCAALGRAMVPGLVVPHLPIAHDPVAHDPVAHDPIAHVAVARIAAVRVCIEAGWRSVANCVAG